MRDELAERAGRGAVLLSRQLHTVGIWESEVAQVLEGIDAELAKAGNPTIGNDRTTTIRHVDPCHKRPNSPPSRPL